MAWPHSSDLPQVEEMVEEALMACKRVEAELEAAPLQEEAAREAAREELDAAMALVMQVPGVWCRGLEGEGKGSREVGGASLFSS